jgi:hypothetical protein
MVDLDFAIGSVKIERFAVSPHLLFALRISNNTPEFPVLNVILNCQIRIEPTRRIYSAPEHERLSELFGEPERWGNTLHGFLWTHVSLMIPPVDTERTVDLTVPCSYDFNLAATKYFHGLEDGDVPLNFLFSGSIFYRNADGQLQIIQVPWTKECGYRLPVSVWRSMMDHYYPQSAWLCLERPAFEALYRYKRQHSLASFELALQTLLDAQPAGAVS